MDSIRTTITRYAIRSAIIIGILGLVCAGLFYWVFPNHYFRLVPAIFIYFYVLSLLLFRYLIKVHDLNMQKFSQRFLIITSVKFFGSIAIVIAFLLLASEHAIPFIVIYIILYFSSLFHEVSSYLRFLNRRSS